jgi:hypothetical protein
LGIQDDVVGIETAVVGECWSLSSCAGHVWELGSAFVLLGIPDNVASIETAVVGEY